MSKRLLLDLYCGAGGCSKGYQRAGFYVVGVDVKKQRHYCGDEFVRADAVEYLSLYGDRFDVVHASPPCQRFSVITPEETRNSHPDLIAATRDAIKRYAPNALYVIENVPGARRELINPFRLCGTQFGLKVYRHRYFESNAFIQAPPHHPHHDRTPPSGRGVSAKGFVSVSGSGGRFSRPLGGGTYGMTEDGFVSVTGHASGKDYCLMAMGIDWNVSVRELSQMIPPPYTEYIGKLLMRTLEK